MNSQPGLYHDKKYQVFEYQLQKKLEFFKKETSFPLLVVWNKRPTIPIKGKSTVIKVDGSC